MNKFIIIILSIIFSQLVIAQDKKATEQLHLYLLGLDVKSYGYQDRAPEVPSLKRVQELVGLGADIHALSITGGNAAHIAIESYCYISGKESESEKELFKIIEYLVSLGSDVSSSDNRGLSPLYVTLRWGGVHSWDKVFDLLVNTGGADVNDLSGPNGSRGLIYLMKGIKYKDALQKLIDMGLDLKQIGYNGLTYAHSVSQINVEGASTSILETITEEKFPGTQKDWLKKKTNSQLTTLHTAAQANNVSALKYLVHNYGLDINAKTDAGLTAADYAKAYKKKEAYEFLKANNAQELEVIEVLNCSSPNFFKPTYSKLKKLILKCGVKSINKLLSLLPKNYLANYVLSFATVAVQGASADYPLVNVYGEDASLMLSFNGNESQRGYKNLEVIQFREDTKTFEMRDIRFPDLESEDVSFSEANPAKCLACHGNSPRPLWDTWTFWPGKFQGESSSMYPKEKKLYKRYLKNRNLGRYQHLPTMGTGVVKTTRQNVVGSGFSNNILDGIIDDLMAKKVSNEIKNETKLRPFRYAILGQLYCSNDNIKSFIPEETLNSFPYSLEFLTLDTRWKATREAENRLILLEKYLNGPPQSRYVLQQKHFGNFFSNQGGRNFRISETAKLRYIVENAGYSMSSWFTPFNGGLESYATGGSLIAALKPIAWKSILESTQDQILIETIEQGSSGSTLKFCTALKEKSIETLSL